jgi:anti-sigma-K factor RskA
MAEVGLTRQEAPLVARLPRPSRVARALTLAAAAVVALVIGLLSFRLVDAQHDLDQSEQVTAVLTSPDATTTRLTGETGITAVVAGSPSLGRTVVALDGLAPVGEDQAYALWLIDAEGPEPMGLVRPDGDQQAVAVIDADLSRYGGFGVTVERRGGSPVPTGPLLVQGKLA